MRPHFGAALFSVLLAAVQAVAAEDRVTWYVTDHPPFFITEGPQAGQGSGDLQMRWLTAHLPNFDHHFEQVSTNRLLYDFEHQDGLCTINIIRTEERKKFMLFNNRPIPMPSWNLIVAADRKAKIAPHLTEAGEADLERMARDGRLVGAYVPGRHYPAPVLALIADPAKAVRLEMVPQTSPMFNLLHGGRVDFVLGLPQETQYYAQRFQDSLPLEVIPIKSAPASIDVYLACSDQPVGRTVIARIDALLQEEKSWSDYVSFLSPWMTKTEFAVALAGRPLPHQP